MTSSISGAYQPAASTGSSMPSVPAPPHDPRKPTAVVVLSTMGTEVTDVLAPYEVLAATGAFNLYAAAPVTQPVPLGGGLDLMPQLTFDELDSRLAGSSPDVIVVPAMPGTRRAGINGDAAVGNWLNRHFDEADTVLSVCNGAEVLGDAGLLEGRRVTANWAGIDTFRERYPGAEWVKGLRYVEDGHLISTAGITSGVNGTLRVVSKYLGDATAGSLARRIGYPDQRLNAAPEIAPQRITMSNGMLYILMAGFDWGKDAVGVALADGVGEIELASVVDVYPGQAFTANVTTLSTAGPRKVVTSKHGLTFVPRHGLDDAPTLDRLLVPGRDSATTVSSELNTWARDRGLQPQYVHADSAGRFPFDLTLTDLARQESTAVAKFDAKALEYPTDHLTLRGPGWPAHLLLVPLGLGLAGLGLAIAVDRWLTRRWIVRCRAAGGTDKGQLESGVSAELEAIGTR
jgi:putative intracellular protease/amidase